MVALAERIIHETQELAICWEQEAFQQVAIQAEALICALEQKSIALSGRIRTGLKTRTEREKEVAIRTGKRGTIRTMDVRVLEISESRLNHWVGDVVLSVPTSISFSLKQGLGEVRHWSDRRTQIVFREYGQEDVVLSPFEPSAGSCSPEKIAQISQILRESTGLIVSVNQSQHITQDLSGRTLTID